jgi:hypothetical protein
VFHVLLIGCDQYPSGYRSLSGCVNDIDAVEDLLFDSATATVGIDQLHVVRLAAKRPDANTTSRFERQTMVPTKANIVNELRSLAGPSVSRDDRVLVYYSGHGDRKPWREDGSWHEAIVPIDIEYLYDVELNGLISAVAGRTRDLTVIIDSCHSGGATRGVDAGEPRGADRRIDNPSSYGPPPDPALITGGSTVGTTLLQTLLPPYVALLACQPTETAGEGRITGGPSHGVFTSALLAALKAMGEPPGRVRWADLWPRLQVAVQRRATMLGRPTQNPWSIGDLSRFVLGGKWEPADLGLGIQRSFGGTYQIDAGTLNGLTPGAVIAVYGPEPLRLPSPGSREELAVRLATLRITAAERSRSKAVDMQDRWEFPKGARAALVQPGTAERLRVLVEGAPAADPSQALASPFLVVVDRDEEPEVKVTCMRDGGWVIGNDYAPMVASVPPGEPEALLAGLAHYARYQLVLRLGWTLVDPALAHAIGIRLLHSAGGPSDAVIPEGAVAELDRAENGDYLAPAGTTFCIEARSTLAEPLYLSVFDCGAAGQVQYLGDVPLGGADRQLLWRSGEIGRPFIADPDFPRGGLDRLVALATTAPDRPLVSLGTASTVQEIVDANLRTRGAPRSALGESIEASPVNRWTAVTVPLRIGPKDGA